LDGLEVLHFPDAVRARVGLYIRSDSTAAGLLATLIQSGLGDPRRGLVVWARVLDDWTVCYTDNGSGICGERSRGISPLEFMMTELPGGGADLSLPFLTGLPLVSALTSSCRICTHGSSGSWTMSTSAGRVSEGMAPVPDEPHGTSIRFTMDRDVIEHPIPTLDEVVRAFSADLEGIPLGLPHPAEPVRPRRMVVMTDERDGRSVTLDHHNVRLAT
jgi:hypothetical protein